MYDNAHLEVKYEFAEHVAEEPSLGDVPHHGGREAEQQHAEVGHRQIHDEDVRNALHGGVPVHDVAHQEISKKSHQKYYDIEDYKDPLECLRENVFVDGVDVLLVVHASDVSVVG